MINESVYRQLRSHLKEDVDERLLTFVASNANGSGILYMSPAQFCMAAEISEEEALAFFKAFGVNSFLAFKRIFREFLYCEATELGVTDRSVSSIADEVIRYELQNLADFSKSLDTVQIKKLAQDILAASEVVLFNYNTSVPSLQGLAKMLRALGIKFYMVTAENIEDTAYLSALDHTALLITFGFPRYTKDALLRLKLLKQQGVSIVSITDSPTSPFAFLSDYFFTVPLRSFDFTESYCAVMSFINILAITIGMLNRDKTFTLLQAREARIDEMNMFF
jgi:DNA-binding MurR/RpiR family transcriptional regulator